MMITQKKITQENQKINLSKILCSKSYAISIALKIVPVNKDEDLKHRDTKVIFTALLKVRSYIEPKLSTKVVTKSLRVVIQDDKILWHGNELILANHDEVFDLISEAIHKWLDER